MSGRVFVVTGGTRGIGRAISERLAADGAHIHMFYRSDSSAAAEAVEAMLPSKGTTCAHAVDVSDPNAVQAAIDAIVAQQGPIAGVVHSAFRSGRPARKVHECPVDAWTEDLAVNLTGPFIVTRACLPSMIDAGFGRIVFIGSLAMRGERGRVAYTVAKNGLVGLAKTLAQEYARHGITANVVSPGYIDAGAFVGLADNIKAAAAKSVPMKRLGIASEIADAVAYFAGDEAGYTTGQVLSVNGGAR